MAERKATECHGGWLACLPGERAVNRIPSPPAIRSRRSPILPSLPVPLLYPSRNAHRGILLGRTRSQAWVLSLFSARRTTTGSALCGGGGGGISMGLHKPNKSLGQRRVLLRSGERPVVVSRSFAVSWIVRLAIAETISNTATVVLIMIAPNGRRWWFLSQILVRRFSAMIVVACNVFPTVKKTAIEANGKTLRRLYLRRLN